MLWSGSPGAQVSVSPELPLPPRGLPPTPQFRSQGGQQKTQPGSWGALVQPLFPLPQLSQEPWRHSARPGCSVSGGRAGLLGSWPALALALTARIWVKAVLRELMGTWDWCHHHLVLTQPEIFASPCPALSLRRPKLALLAELALAGGGKPLTLALGLGAAKPPGLDVGAIHSV